MHSCQTDEPVHAERTAEVRVATRLQGLYDASAEAGASLGTSEVQFRVTLHILCCLAAAHIVARLK